jgi:CCR4-NOT transcription complex subunit 3
VRCHTVLLTARPSLTVPSMSSRPRYYHPRNPYQTPPYYPQQPHPMLDDKTIYSRMDLDTLFFIFYYRTNTYEQ